MNFNKESNRNRIFHRLNIKIGSLILFVLLILLMIFYFAEKYQLKKQIETCKNIKNEYELLISSYKYDNLDNELIYTIQYQIKEIDSLIHIIQKENNFFFNFSRSLISEKIKKHNEYINSLSHYINKLVISQYDNSIEYGLNDKDNLLKHKNLIDKLNSNERLIHDSNKMLFKYRRDLRAIQYRTKFVIDSLHYIINKIDSYAQLRKNILILRINKQDSSNVQKRDSVKFIINKIDDEVKCTKDSLQFNKKKYENSTRLKVHNLLQTINVLQNELEKFQKNQSDIENEREILLREEESIRNINFGIMKSQKQLSGSFKSIRLYRDIKDVKGNLAYNIPDSMELNKNYLITLSISRYISLTELSQEVLKYSTSEKFTTIDTNKIELKKIRTDTTIIGKYLIIKLIDPYKENSPNYSIRSLTKDEQIVDLKNMSSTTWQWDIIPLLEGEHPLILSISLKFNDENETFIKSIPVYRKTILIYSKSVIRNVNWYIYLFCFVPILLFVFFLKLRKHKNRLSFSITSSNEYQKQKSINGILQYTIKIKDYIASGKLEKSIEELVLLAKYIKDSEIENQVILQSAYLNGYKQKVIMGTLTNEELNLERNKIINALLFILDRIDKKEFDMH